MASTPLLSKMFRVSALPWWTYLVLVIGFLCRDLPVFHGMLMDDPDNYLRATQILEFMQHGRWFDTMLPRLDPPGVDVYSRLVDVPYLLVAWPLQHFCDVRTAIWAAAIVVPLFLLVPLYLWLSVWMARPFVGEPWCFLAPVGAVFCGPTIFCFNPGAIDHHNVQILLVMGMFGAYARLLRMWSDGDDLRPQCRMALLLSFLTAFSLAIGIEALPYIGLMLGSFIVMLVMEGAKGRSRSLKTLAISLPVFQLLFLLITRDADHWFEHVTFRLSWIHVVLDLIGSFVIVALLATDKWWTSDKARLRVVGACCFLGMILMVYLVPDIYRGVWLGIDPETQDYAVRFTLEFRPALLNAGGGFLFFSSYVVALGGFAFFAFSPKGNYWLGIVGLVFVLGITAGTYFAFQRIGRFSVPFYVVGTLFFIKQGFIALEKTPMDRKRVFTEIALCLLLGPLAGPMFLSTLANNGIVDAVFFFAQHEKPSDDMQIVSTYLNRDEIAQSPKRVLIAANLGPELVFRTNHIAVGSGQAYTHVGGYKINMAFYRAKTAQAAAKVLRDNDIDYVLANKELFKAFDGEIKKRDKAEKIEVSDGQQNMLALIQDDRPPAFLRTLPLPLASLRLYRVDKGEGS